MLGFHFTDLPADFRGQLIHVRLELESVLIRHIFLYSVRATAEQISAHIAFVTRWKMFKRGYDP